MRVAKKRNYTVMIIESEIIVNVSNNNKMHLKNKGYDVSDKTVFQKASFIVHLKKSLNSNHDSSVVFPL